VTNLLLQRWVDGGYPRDVGEALLRKYDEPQRRYHTRAHLEHAFRVLDTDSQAIEAAARLSETDRQALELALWYHDREYSPTEKLNEERSAVQFLGDAAALPVGREARARVGGLILLSRHHRAPEGDLLAELFSDLDLAVLGEPEQAYEAYSEAIRAEYAHVPLHAYAHGRGRVLDALLSSPRIFSVLVDREAQARRNLRRERETLRTSGALLLWEQRLRVVGGALFCVAGLAGLLTDAARVEALGIALVLAVLMADRRARRAWRGRVESAVRDGLLPYPDLPRRQRLWSALSDLYLDAEIDPGRIAGEVRALGYSADEAWDALRYQVGPAVWLNLLSPAGVWQGFDADWLRTEILLRAAGRPSILRRRATGRVSNWMVRAEFEKIGAMLAPP